MKIVGTATYMHRSYLDTKEIESILPSTLLEDLRGRFNSDKFDVIKYDSKTNRCSLITCEDWEGQREPIIFKAQMLDYICNVWCKTSFRAYEKENKPIYHHKHMFVPDHYEGFDITSSKAWSETWEQHIEKGDKRKVGYVHGWKDFLKKNNLPIV